ncbi:DNA starvation/stationary phase protection protein [Hoeflea sp. G2-23]|uniref:DNA starvation/stationary phase protection protein n=1 Tax=Hoeflea algicola TaxID=2983763 RepID=A0ABT3Z7B9_9HYPH|nr:DNA starvation/stationary phase protection protein [Hoeflea algicola]MCY0147673.1 DNA starvation/stationary phase protection protein [Hoeflea algicola]
MANSALASLTPETGKDSINIGLKADYRKSMAQDLSEILAATYRLTIKSHVYHWNVVGPIFKPIHDLTEAHYNALFADTDIIAERIRALGHLAPVNFDMTKSFAPTKSDVNQASAHDMVNDLIKDHEEAVRDARKAAGKAGDNDDVVTEDMLTARLTFHEKALWMLRAIISG